MKAFFLPIVSALTLLIPSTVLAAGYGAAGCGLGSLLFKDSPGSVQIFASTTNGTSGSQTFGITSGTSNCGPDGLVMGSREQKLFVKQNFDTLSKEMAKGSGETLATLAGLMGCSRNQVNRVGSVTRENYKNIFKKDRQTA